MDEGTCSKALTDISNCIQRTPYKALSVRPLPKIDRRVGSECTFPEGCTLLYSSFETLQHTAAQVDSDDSDVVHASWKRVGKVEISNSSAHSLGLHSISLPCICLGCTLIRSGEERLDRNEEIEGAIR